METKNICGIRRIYKAINSFEKRLEDSMGLNLNEAMLLCLLSDDTTLTAGEIAEAMQLTRSNTSKVISSLERRHYLRRRVCKNDNRSMCFHLTKAGSEMLGHLHCDSLQLPDDLKPLQSLSDDGPLG